jgi:hypothetical protein
VPVQRYFCHIYLFPQKNTKHQFSFSPLSGLIANCHHRLGRHLTAASLLWPPPRWHTLLRLPRAPAWRIVWPSLSFSMRLVPALVVSFSAACSAMLSVKLTTQASAGHADSSHSPQNAKVPALNLGGLSHAAPPVQSARTFASARLAPQKSSSHTPRTQAPLTSRDPPTPDVHHQLSSLRPPALLSSARSASANEQSFRPSFSRIDERVDMRPFSEAGTSMIGSEELGRVQSSLLKHVPVGGHRHYNHVAQETTQRFTDFAELMAVSCCLLLSHAAVLFVMRSMQFH